MRRLFKVRLRLPMADTVRFNFRAIKALSIFESSNVKSCASSARDRRNCNSGVAGFAEQLFF